MITEESKVKEVREYLIERAEEGVRCPCCNRLVKVYRRKLHSEMALFLCLLVKRWRQVPRYFSTSELVPGTNKSTTDGAYLVHWGLVEREPAKNTAGGRAGMYRPTPKGVEFAEGRLTVPSHIHTLCGDLIGFSEEQVSIEHCLGSRFDYDELMGTLKDILEYEDD